MLPCIGPTRFFPSTTPKRFMYQLAFVFLQAYVEFAVKCYETERIKLS